MLVYKIENIRIRRFTTKRHPRVTVMNVSRLPSRVLSKYDDPLMSWYFNNRYKLSAKAMPKFKYFNLFKCLNENCSILMSIFPFYALSLRSYSTLSLTSYSSALRKNYFLFCYSGNRVIFCSIDCSISGVLARECEKYRK